MTGTATILRGNALDLPLADASVDLIVTSPPYFGLRSYQDGGEHYAGQIGSEATPAEFVDALLAATAEMVRVLKPSGSLWVNLGDKYSNGGRTSYDVTDINGARGGIRARDGFPPKTLLGIPWRYAIACIDQLGLILRAEVIWAKPNGLPESVTDRVRRSHEQWFHFVKQPRYFSAVDEIREAQVSPVQRTKTGASVHRSLGRYAIEDDRDQTKPTFPVMDAPNPLGKLPGSVWSIPTQPLTVPAHLGVDHFAAFPMEWPRRIIRGWSPSGVCTACGEGRRPVVVKSLAVRNRNVTPIKHATDPRNEMPSDYYANTEFQGSTEATVTGYACACPDPTAPTTPAVILDPFGGTGTVALVAKALGRHGISLDMSADYCRLATWRTTDEGELARALQVDKPAKQVNGQLSLLEGLA